MRTSRRKQRRTSRNPRRRRHRLTSRNPIPKPPSASNYRAWWHWISKTFAPGTTVMAKEPLLGYLHTPNTQTRPKYVVTTVDIPVGAKGVVTDCHQSTNEGTYPSYIRMEFFPSWQVPAGTWALVYVSGDDRDAVEDTIEALDDNWGPAPRPLGRHALPRAQRSWLKPNIPVDKLSVPMPPGGSKQWQSIAFAPGTPVKLLIEPFRSWDTRGVIVRLGDYIVVQITDARDSAGFQYADIIGKTITIDNNLDLEPLVDNWASAALARPLGRHNLPRTQRSQLKPNIPVDKLAVPPRRVLNPLDMVLQGQWVATTYAPGTPVKLLRRDLLAFGTRGVVVTIRQHGPVVVRILDARDREGIPVSSLVGKEYDSYNPLDELEPMVDNWASASPQRLQRYQLPRTQRSWLKP